MKLFAISVASLVVSLQVLLVVPQVQASTLTMGFDVEFSGGREPGAPRPWIVSTFADGGTPGSVRLTLSASGLASGENIKEVFFNLNTGLNAADLDFTFLPSLSTGPAARRVRTGTDAFKAASSGKYDLLFQFQSGKGFDAGESVAYDIFGIEGLSPEDFNALSKPIGSHDPYFAAAHVQNTTGGSGGGDSDDDSGDDSDDSGDSGATGSAWISPTAIDLGGAITQDQPVSLVPVPPAVWLFGSGLLGLLGVAGKRSSKALRKS